MGPCFPLIQVPGSLLQGQAEGRMGMECVCARTCVHVCACVCSHGMGAYSPDGNGSYLLEAVLCRMVPTPVPAPLPPSPALTTWVRAWAWAERGKGFSWQRAGCSRVGAPCPGAGPDPSGKWHRSDAGCVD